MRIDDINKANNINNLTDVNDIKRTQKDKTEQDKDVQNVGYKNSTTEQDITEGKVYHDDIGRCKEYFIQSLKDSNVLKSISLDDINEIFNKYLKDQVTADNYSNTTPKVDIFTEIQQLYNLDASVISIIKTCFTKAKKKYEEPDDDESEEEEPLEGSINRNNTSLNIIFNSKENNMRKLIKSDITDVDYEDGECVTGGWIDSSRKPVKSGRYIKSGTSNFGSNNDIFGYNFPLVTYIAENYRYDEETDSETEERDYDADSWEYEDALSNAKDLADEMDIPQYDDYSEPYLCYEPFMIKFRDGYYEGLWIEVKEGTDETPYDENGEYQSNFDWKPFTEEQMNKYVDKLNEYFNRLCLEYGWQKLGVAARFDNGETWYSKIDSSRKPVKSSQEMGSKHYDVLDNYGGTVGFDMTLEDANDLAKDIDGIVVPVESSRKPIQSKITQRELKDMINQGQAIDITYGDAPEGVRLDVLQISKGTYGMNGALFKGSDGNLYVIGGRTTNLFRYV